MFIKLLGFFTHPINDRGAESNELRRGNDQKKGIAQKRSAYLGDVYQPPCAQEVLPEFHQAHEPL